MWVGGSFLGGRREVFNPRDSAFTSEGVFALFFSRFINSANWIKCNQFVSVSGINSNHVTDGLRGESSVGPEGFQVG